jgi:hypothetical protein
MQQLKWNLGMGRWGDKEMGRWGDKEQRGKIPNS